MNKPEDSELIISARDGDPKAFEMLINRYYERMYAIAFKWSRNRADAEDITQMACINMAKGIRGLHNELLFQTWLYRVVINAAKDFYRQYKRTETLPDKKEHASETSSPEDILYAQEILREIYSLPEKEKDAILLVFGEGLSHGAAAQILGCAETTISWRIHRARARLDKRRVRKG